MPTCRLGWLFSTTRLLCLLSALFPWAPTILAQSGKSFIAPSADAFHQTVQRSGLIFVGTVTAVQCDVDTAGLPRTYRVSLQVKQGIRGVRTGASLTIREWAGLWAMGARRPRYRVGERAVLFLYPVSRAGLTSTVGGSQGKLAVQGGLVDVPPNWIGSIAPTPTVAASAAALALSGPDRVPLAQLVQLAAPAAGAAARGEP